MSKVRREPSPPTVAGGDTDIAVIGALVADPGRCQILLALDDGRALPASRLAAEAGVSPATASTHLGKLVEGGLLAVEPHGRYRYYRLAGPAVGDLIEALQQLAPAAPVRSLRQGTKAQALRAARTCYDHLAGRVGVDLMGAMLEQRYLTGGEGCYDPTMARQDRPTGYGHDVSYAITSAGSQFLHGLGVPAATGRSGTRYCVDWSEQRHHLSGPLGRELLQRFVELGWLRRSEHSRALQVTEAGRKGLFGLLGIDAARTL